MALKTVLELESVELPTQTRAGFVDRKTFIPVPKSRAFKVFFSIVVALMCLEAAARAVVAIAKPPQYGHVMFDQKLALACKPPQDGKRSLLFLGTSYIEQGIYSDLIALKLKERGVDLDVRNLAVRGSWPHDQLFLLDKAVKHGTRPAAVFCDVGPLGIGWDTRTAECYSPQLAGSIAAFELIPNANGLSDKAKRFLLDNSYLFRFQRYFKALLMKLPELVFDPRQTFTMLEKEETLLDMSPSGWVAAGEIATYDTINLTVEKKIQRYKSWLNNRKPDKKYLQCSGFAALKKYCKEQCIPLVLLWMPCTPQAERIWQGSMDLSSEECLECFSKLADGEDTWFVDLHSILTKPGVNGCDKSKFVDCDHLNALGGIATSEYITELLLKPPYASFLKEKPE